MILNRMLGIFQTYQWNLFVCGCCNTLVLSMHLALAFYEHKHHPSIHEHEHVKFHFIHLLFITSYVNNIHVSGCDLV